MCSIRIIESKAITQLVLSIQQADRNYVAEWDRAIFQIAMNPREQPGETGAGENIEHVVTFRVFFHAVRQASTFSEVSELPVHDVRCGHTYIG